MFGGHRVVCYEHATIADVHEAHVIVAAFRNPKRITDGWDFSKSLLEKLAIDGKSLVGKVLIHLDDEYGARNPRTEADWNTYCAMYAGWRHVFRNYWSEAWAAHVGRNHVMNCSAMCTTATGGAFTTAATETRYRSARSTLGGPRVEWTPLGWSANWQPGAPSKRASSRSAMIGFYGNEKYQLRPNRGALIGRFERETGLTVERMLGRVGFGRGNATHYVHLMHDTRLCLQISGLSAECYRMYEALDAGCTPVLINQFGKETATQYTFLLGSGGGAASSPALGLGRSRARPPFPWAESPAELKQTLEALSNDGAALDTVQRQTARWWNQSLVHLRTRVQASAWAVRRSCSSPG